MVAAFQMIKQDMDELGHEGLNESSEVGIAVSIEADFRNCFQEVIDRIEDMGTDDAFPRSCLQAMEELWEDPAVQARIRLGGKFALHDNLQ